MALLNVTLIYPSMYYYSKVSIKMTNNLFLSLWVHIIYCDHYPIVIYIPPCVVKYIAILQLAGMGAEL